MSQPGRTRSDAAVERAREERVDAVELRLVARLAHLRQCDRAGYDALVGMLRRVVSYQR